MQMPERPDPPPEAWAALLALLPELENPHRPPVHRWITDSFPYPENDSFLPHFFEQVSRSIRLETVYDPATAGRWANDAPGPIATSFEPC